MVDEKVLFTSSLDLTNHPMNNVKPELKKQYSTAGNGRDPVV